MSEPAVAKRHLFYQDLKVLVRGLRGERRREECDELATRLAAEFELDRQVLDKAWTWVHVPFGGAGEAP